MGLASALNTHTTIGLQWAPLSGTGERLILGQRPAHLLLPLRSTPTLCFAHRRNRSPTLTSLPKNNKNNNKLQKLEKNEDDIEDIDDDALEALFSQLEEDLKNEDPRFLEELEKELSTEDLEKLDLEMAEMDEEIAKVFDMAGFESDEDFEDDEEDEDQKETNDIDEDEDEEEQIQLKNWQIRRLAMALKTGRRKTNIKNLAAELCIDRSIVLSLLRNPPPSLLFLSEALPDAKPSSPIITTAATHTIETVAETIPEPEATPTPKPKNPVKVPVHVMQERFSSQKRIKKSHIQTLENVYARSKRPTNSMIQSIVAVTNLPRKRVLKWFEDKRAEEGVPEKRSVYQRSVSDTQ